jgi:hypothetical protein
VLKMYYKDSAMDINRNNYETSFLLYLDRELGPAEMSKVEMFLSENPDLQKEFELLQQTIFLPEEIVYGQKELLFHKREKRKVIPLYWVRIAASVLVLITAGWFLITNIQMPAKKVPVNNDLKINNQTDQTVGKDIIKNKGQSTQNGDKGIAKNSEQTNQSTVKRLPEKNNSIGKTSRYNSINQTRDTNSNSSSVPDESLVTIQKSNTALAIQPERPRIETDSKQISVLPGTQAPALVLVTAGSKDQLKHENADLKENAIQTENAISVVALDDQNKNITGFLKKLTRQNPDDDKTNNTRKVRVSVFQLSY